MLNNRFKLAISFTWMPLLAGVGVVWLRSGVGWEEIPHHLEEHLSHFGLLPAALIYILLYTVRPVVLFPATLLTMASGLIFGPWLGILFTMLGENASANVAFSIARWLGRDWVSAHEHGRLREWDTKIQENALTTVLVMRLVYLPFDAVNYGCGLTAMRQRDFFLGTFLGIIPGLVSFVLLGGSGHAGIQNRALLLGLAVFFFALGLAVARLLRRSANVPAGNPTEARTG